MSATTTLIGGGKINSVDKNKNKYTPFHKNIKKMKKNKLNKRVIFYTFLKVFNQLNKHIKSFLELY